MDPLSLIVIISLAVLIDLIFGELPAKIHPVVLIGKFIEIFKIFKENHSCLDNRLAGVNFDHFPNIIVFRMLYCYNMDF